MSCDEDLQSWGWTDLSVYSLPSSDAEDQEQQIESLLVTRNMSRCSLRLDDSRLDRSSGSLSVGGASWGSARLPKSRHSQRLSLSCSESLLRSTPRKPSSQSLHNSSVHSEASDASLLSSLLDESSIKEHTLVDSLWGLEHDVDPKESTIVAEHNTVLADQTLIGPDDCCARHPVQTLSRIHCESSSDGKDDARRRSFSCGTMPNAKEPETPVIYCRERTRKSRTGGWAAEASRWFGRQWHHLTSSPLLTRSPLVVLLLLLPLLLLFTGLRWFSPAVSDVPTLVPCPPAEGGMEEQREAPPLSEPHPGAESGQDATSADSPGRLLHLEQSLSALWEQVEAGGRREEQRHREVLQLYAQLQEQQAQQIRAHLERERHKREQGWLQRISQTSRVEQLERQLQTLAVQTEELQRKQEMDPPPAMSLPAAVSGGVDRQSYDALLVEVARLQAALEELRLDVESLSVCREACGQLSHISQTQVSAQVRDEVRVLLYGNQLAVRGGASPDGAPTAPESLPEWLSQRYVSNSHLQAALSSLQLDILRNISLLVGRGHGGDSGAEDAPHGAAPHGAAVTREDVHVMVEDALRRFSQDRTGLPDYALESGGGSIISTRCSETFETKAALLSLFGVPLWYFSQSPRAVIQPDVHPGNCWAFKGSNGFLVIRLSMRIVVTAVSLEHIPKALAPSGTLLSAPRDFSVYGLEDVSEEAGELLGTFTYEEDGEALQTFAVMEASQRSFQILELQVLTNWGHPDYTCMYRVRVHGTPV
ncbi:uncharacterized protein LOC142894027 isoform X2 [Nelusetta ayraudi]|uniref:uncharacterized protein LOC142894027 isoform X2 n=1 Tax=Nelusetta ayraudi TaxID=303726 RepID=UPI003F6F1BBB